jgi:hypothetical protein
MEVTLRANMCDLSTRRIADALHAPLKAMGRNLSKDYGGAMKHLWIDFELIESHAERHPPYLFRFQKKVGGSSPDKLTGLPRRVYESVGHYSVRPDFQHLRSVPQESIVSYVLSLIYASTSVLIEKQKRLGGFDAQKFRSDFIVSCRQHGYEISVSTSPP